MKLPLHIACLLVLLSGVSHAADLNGAWNATTRMPDGSRHDSVLNLNVQGTKLTGKIVSKRGTAEITDGIVDGNNVSFTVVRVGNGDELRIQFRGNVEGDTMKLRMQYRDHDPMEVIAKRH
jgi:endonuclease YncB( thermonuclease family)